MEARRAEATLPGRGGSSSTGLLRGFLHVHFCLLREEGKGLAFLPIALPPPRLCPPQPVLGGCGCEQKYRGS